MGDIYQGEKGFNAKCWGSNKLLLEPLLFQVIFKSLRICKYKLTNNAYTLDSHPTKDFTPLVQACKIAVKNEFLFRKREKAHR